MKSPLISLRFAVCSLTLFFHLLPVSAALRTFTDTKGRKIEAQIVSVAGANVTLKLANGRSSTIPIKLLSENDQMFVKVCLLYTSPSPRDRG